MYDKEIRCTNTNRGYLYFCDSGHPLADINGRVYLHRHLASIKLGRWVTSEEVVHHIDENKLNNSDDNLQVLSSSEHASIHAIEKGLKLTQVLHCLNCGSSFKQDSTKQIFCSKECSSLSQVKDKTITKELLDKLIPTMTWTKLGQLFGYSDNGIKKRAISLGCDIKSLRKK
jgi:hypothetical protein